MCNTVIPDLSGRVKKDSIFVSCNFVQQYMQETYRGSYIEIVHQDIKI